MRYSTSRARLSVTSLWRLAMPTDSATSRMLSGFQTDILLSFFYFWEVVVGINRSMAVVVISGIFGGEVGLQERS